MRTLIITTLLLLSYPASAQNSVSSPSGQSPEQIQRYWTPERMKNAQPMPMGVVAKEEQKTKDHLTINKLIQILGQEEALRLRFITQDQNAQYTLTPMGQHFLQDTEKHNIQSVAEAYARGFQTGHTP